MKAKRIHPEDYRIKVGRGEILKKGNDVTVIACSTMVSNSLEASNILKGRHIDTEVINMHTLKPVDSELILESSARTGRVVTVEEHTVVGGLGSSVADVLVKGNPVKMDMIGIEDKFALVGQYPELIDYYGLTPEKIADSIEQFLR
ncbi:MAG: hypothetical protein JW770_02115 [Actinobacteria bacterium]|nr:hypothetical protein [Actinomycetota bacterium]